MSGEIVNLRRARKAKARLERAAMAAGQRVRFGRPKSEREHEDKVRAIESRRLDGHHRDGGDALPAVPATAYTKRSDEK